MGFPVAWAEKKVPKSEGIESNPHDGMILIPYADASA